MERLTAPLMAFAMILVVVVVAALRLFRFLTWPLRVLLEWLRPPEG